MFRALLDRFAQELGQFEGCSHLQQLENGVEVTVVEKMSCSCLVVVECVSNIITLVHVQ